MSTRSRLPDCEVPPLDGIGEFWQFTPERHVRDYQQLTWTPERPAPEGIVYDLIILGLKLGRREPKVGLRGLRAIARYAGWGTTRAKRVLAEAQSAWLRWMGDTQSQEDNTCATGTSHLLHDEYDIFDERRNTCAAAPRPACNGAFSSFHARDNSQHPHHNTCSPGVFPPYPPPSTAEPGAGGWGPEKQQEDSPLSELSPDHAAPSGVAGLSGRETPQARAPIAPSAPSHLPPQPVAPPPPPVPPTPPPAASPPAPAPRSVLRIPATGATPVGVLPAVLADPLRCRGYTTLEVVCEQTRGQLAREQLWPRGRIQGSLDALEAALSERGLALLTTEEMLARIHERAAARGQVVPLPARRGGAAPLAEEEDPFTRWTGKSLGLDAQYAHLPFFKGAAHGQ